LRTTLYLIRHAATGADLAQPPRVQGRRYDPPLAKLGVQQAAATRDFLSARRLDACYCSPLLRAVQTATIIAEPHGLAPEPVAALTECDVGGWEGMDWQQVRYLDADNYEQFAADPAAHGYPGGETFAQVAGRVTAAIDEIMSLHAGRSVLVVSHQEVNRLYLASLLGLGAGRAGAVALDTCGISVVVRDAGRTSVATLNAAFHLQNLAA
jgi:broad specificity phosphatase PhoE